MLMIMDQHLGKRPIAFGASEGEWLGLNRSVVKRGLSSWIVPKPESLPGVIRGVNDGIVDTAVTRRLVDEVYRYAGLFDVDTLVLEPAARQLAASLAQPLLELAQAAILRRDQASTLTHLRRALHLMPNRQLQELHDRIESQGLDVLLQQPPEPQQRP
jgi:hypothetical protein